MQNINQPANIGRQPIQILRVGTQQFNQQRPYEAESISKTHGNMAKPGYNQRQVNMGKSGYLNHNLYNQSQANGGNYFPGLLQRQPQNTMTKQAYQDSLKRTLSQHDHLKNVHIPLRSNNPSQNLSKKPGETFVRPASFVSFDYGQSQGTDRKNSTKTQNIGDVYEEDRDYQLIGQSQIDCPVCCQRIYSFSIISIQGCRDSLHKKCLLPYLQRQIQDGKVEKILCPLASCKKKSLLSEKFLRRMLSSDDLERYFRFSQSIFIAKIIVNQQFSVCPQPGCEELFRRIHSPQAKYKPNKNLLECSKTLRKICAKCLNTYHPQFTCQEFLQTADPKLNQKKALQLIMKEKWSQCPSCKIFVEKNQGCDHITCRCGHHFCYKCRGPYPKCYCSGAQERMNYIPPEIRANQINIPPRNNRQHY